MSLPKVQPQGGTPTAQDFTSLQTQWARQIDPVVDQFNAGGAVPIGTIWQWPSTTPPENFLVLSGQVVLQKQYPALFRLMGTTYNTGGEPAGSFRLPAGGSPLSLIIKATQ